jgi:CRISPR/Cas system-associated endonuclease Cas1
MSEHRVLLIEHQAYLSIDLGRLCIRRPQQENEFVLPADIAMLCLHHPAITVTAHTLQTLSQEGAIVLVTDDQHLPLAQVYPCFPPCVRYCDCSNSSSCKSRRGAASSGNA